VYLEDDIMKLSYIYILNLFCVLLFYYFVQFILSNPYPLVCFSIGHNCVFIQNLPHVYMHFFLSQRPKKSSPIVMSKSHESPRILNEVTNAACFWFTLRYPLCIWSVQRSYRSAEVRVTLRETKFSSSNSTTNGATKQ